VALINVLGTGVPELAYVQPDHLGTPRVVIDPVGQVGTLERCAMRCASRAIKREARRMNSDRGEPPGSE